MTAEVIGTLEILNSRIDKYGNCYYAMRYNDHATDRTVVGLISGNESNLYAACKHIRKGDDSKGVMVSQSSMPIRKFDTVTKGWPYAGCTPEEIANFIHTELNK